MVLHNLCVDANCRDHRPPEPSTHDGDEHVQATLTRFVKDTEVACGMNFTDNTDTDSERNRRGAEPAGQSRRDELCAAVNAANLRRPGRSQFSHC
jgi:hypothetical protein